jgi:ribonuclease G
MKEDRAKHKILPPSKFGLIQITRQRVRPEMNIKTKESNPNGPTGLEVEAPIVLIDKINHQLDLIIKKGNKKVTLNTHPFIAAFITKGFPSIRLKWFFQYKVWVKIMPRDAYTYLEHRFKDGKGKTIKL